MPTFDTPKPISVTIDLALGDARINASDRTDTVVDVRPSDGSNESDVKAAGQTRVEFSNGMLLVKAPKPHGRFRKGGSVDLTIALPTGSHIQGDASMADFHCDGQLGECRLKTSAGNIRLGDTGPLYLKTAIGDITVDRAKGHTDVTSGSGAVRIGEIDGAAAIKNSNGDTWVGEITGDLRLSAANGDISVDRAHAAVGARTANGSIRIGEVVRGSVELQTALGTLEVGIREGTTAWLNVSSKLGKVDNSLDTSDGPEKSGETVKVRARTSFGDIVIRRA